jgi:hypothetical protein
MIVAILVAPVVIEHSGCASSYAVDTRSHRVGSGPGDVGIGCLVDRCDSRHLRVSIVSIVSIVCNMSAGSVGHMGSVGVTPSGRSRG